jgi:hypothetical protein
MEEVIDMLCFFFSYFVVLYCFQVGMALYTGKISLGHALCAPLHSDRHDQVSRHPFTSYSL